MEDFKEYDISINGVKETLKWPAADQGCLGGISRDWAHMSPFIHKSTLKWDIVVQAGGNCGLYPKLYGHMYEKVFTFEPDPTCFTFLSENCQSPNIYRFNAGLSDVAGYQTIGNAASYNVGMSKLGTGNIEIYTITLDSLDLPGVDLIHLDVEGWESKVLQGARNTIVKYMPTILFEVDNPSAEEFLTPLGYVVMHAFDAPDTHMLNKIMVHKDSAVYKFNIENETIFNRI